MRPRLVVFAILFYLAATLVFLYPLPLHLGDRIFENGDSYLLIWISSWEAHWLSTQSTPLFDGNIFYPEANTLALSELVTPDLVIFAPVLALTHNPLIAYNFTLVLTFPLSAISMLVLVFYLTRRFPAAFVAGFIFGFTPIRLSHLHHLQLLSLMWLPCIFVMFDRWLKYTLWRDALATAGFFVAQYLTTVYVGLYLVPVLLVYFITHIIVTKDRWRGRLIFQASVASALGVATLAFFLQHYRAVHQEWNIHPEETLKIFFSSDLWRNLLAIFPTNVLYGKLLHPLSSPPYERFYFTGFLAVLLAVLAWGFRRDRIVKVFFVLSITCYLMALGPFLQISGQVTKIPLPYKWLIDPLPGFSMLRVPARAGLILIATMTVLAAYGWIHLFEWIQSKLKSRGMMLTETSFCVVSVLLLGLEFLSIPIPLLSEVSGNHIPPVYHFLKNYPEPGGVLEIPVVFHEDGGEPTVRAYTYFSAYHFKPIVIGYSGYFPPPFYELVATARRLPAQQSLDTFEAIGVRTIVLHARQISSQENQAWEAALKSGTRLKRVTVFPDGDEVIALQPRMRISQNLNDANWSLRVPSSARRAGEEITVSLQTDGIRSASFDYVANPQLPHPPEKLNSRVSRSPAEAEWLDPQRNIIYRQRLKVRFPYLLNHASILMKLATPKRSGNYRLRLRILESPPLEISANITIP